MLYHGENYNRIWKEYVRKKIYELFQENSTIDSPDLSPGSSPLNTNRTNRTRTESLGPLEENMNPLTFSHQRYNCLVNLNSS